MGMKVRMRLNGGEETGIERKEAEEKVETLCIS
jgi:hypothetical protein